MIHRRRVDALIDAFLTQFPGPGVEGVSQAFALFALARGASVRIVHAEDGDHPTHSSHTWVRVLNVEGIHGYDVDVTADRFGDPELDNPLVWRMDGQHPVTGVHRTMRVTPPVAAGG